MHHESVQVDQVFLHAGVEELSAAGERYGQLLVIERAPVRFVVERTKRGSRGWPNVRSCLFESPLELRPQHLLWAPWRAMLGFDCQPLPGPCHVEQDVAHSQARGVLGHLTAFGGTLYTAVAERVANA